MLPSPALAIADRLIVTVVKLLDAVGAIALARGTPTLPAHPAQTLFCRLIGLVAALVRISTLGVRTRADPTTPAHCPPEPVLCRPRLHATPSLPRRPGWLLAALPDLAPAIAADLGALLADPALAALLAAAPVLNRTLGPLLRSLGLTLPASPDAPPPHTPSPKSHPENPPQTVPVAPSSQARPSQTSSHQTAKPKSTLPALRFLHAYFVPISE